MNDILPVNLLFSLEETDIEFAPVVAGRVLLIGFRLVLDNSLKRHNAGARMHKAVQRGEQSPALALVRVRDDFRQHRLRYDAVAGDSEAPHDRVEIRIIRERIDGAGVENQPFSDSAHSVTLAPAAAGTASPSAR